MRQPRVGCGLPAGWPAAHTPRHHLAALGKRGHIGLGSDDIHALGSHRSEPFVATRLTGQAIGGDTHAGGGQTPANGRANAAHRPGNQSNPSHQTIPCLTLKRNGNTHATADTHRGQPFVGATADHFMDQ